MHCLNYNFYRLIQVDRNRYNMTYFLNFIFNSFITLQFIFRFHSICRQLKLNQNPTNKRTRKGKERKHVIQPS